MTEKEKMIQVGYKIPESKKNILMARLRAQGSNFQEEMEKYINNYFNAFPITEAERVMQESLNN